MTSSYACERYAAKKAHSSQYPYPIHSFPFFASTHNEIRAPNPPPPSPHTILQSTPQGEDQKRKGDFRGGEVGFFWTVRRQADQVM